MRDGVGAVGNLAPRHRDVQNEGLNVFDAHKEVRLVWLGLAWLTLMLAPYLAPDHSPYFNNLRQALFAASSSHWLMPP
jgi:hypothetical protein